MSLNSLIDTQYLQELQVLAATLEKLIPRWRAAGTLEDQLLVESEAMDLYDRLSRYDYNLGEVSVLDNPELQNFRSAYQDYEILLNSTRARFQKLSETFLRHFNSHNIALMEVDGKYRSIKQKQAALGLWDGKARKIVATHFRNLRNLDSSYAQDEQLYVDTDQGIMVLPVLGQQEVRPQDVKIAAGSNGVPGNSDSRVDTDTQDPRALLAEDPNKWFEYERLDDGPLVLQLQLVYSQPRVINQLEIQPAAVDNSFPLDVQDITFTLVSGESIGLSQMFDQGSDDPLWLEHRGRGPVSYKVTFLPVEVTAVVVKLVQRHGESVQMAIQSPDGGIEYVGRERYVLALKSITTHAVQYKSQGSIGSTGYSLAGYYAAAPVVDIAPRSNLYKQVLEFSSDAGQTWKTALDSSEHTIALTGQPSTCLWRYRLERNDQAVARLENLYGGQKQDLQHRLVLQPVSKSQSPASIRLGSVVNDQDLHVYQPRAARLGDKTATTVLGYGFGTGASYRLPRPVIKAIASNLLDARSVRVVVNGMEYYQTDSDTVAAAGTYRFSSDYQDLVFDDQVPTGQTVSIFLDHELLSFEERTDGYYATPKMPFDPDAQSIEIKYMAGRPERTSFFLPKNKQIVQLGKKPVVPGSLTLISAEDRTWTQVDTLSDLYDEAGRFYYVDELNGTLHLGKYVGADNVRVSFLHYQEKTLTTGYHVVFDKAKPVGIKIDRDVFDAQEIRETIGDGLLPVPQSTGAVEMREEFILTSTTSRQLSHERIVRNSFVAPRDLLESELGPKEVLFIDGHSEFRGIAPVEREQTVSITAGTDGVVSFRLGARGLWYQDIEPVFAFIDPVVTDTNPFLQWVEGQEDVDTGDVGDYTVDDDGTVYLNVGPSAELPAGIGIHYYYRDPAFDPAGKFSVDYELGVLHGSSDLNQDAVVRYKACQYKIAYDVVNELQYQYDSVSRVVQVYTEKLEGQSLVKVNYREAPVVQNTAKLTNFYTPIVRSIGFRLS